MRLCAIFSLTLLVLAGQHPPAGTRPVVRGQNGTAILPGGRIIQPFGEQFPTGPGPYGLVADPTGRLIVTANVGPERASVTVFETRRSNEWTLHNFFAQRFENKGSESKEGEFQTLYPGIALVNEHNIWVSAGASGLVQLIDVNSGPKKKVLDLNGGGVTDSYSGALAYDANRGLLYVADLAHARVVVFEIRGGGRTATLSTGFPPDAISLSPDGHRAWIAGLPVKPHDPSLSVFDMENPESPRLVAALDVESPSGVLATAEAVYVASAADDRIDVLDPVSNSIRVAIPLRIPGFESLRGIVPLGMALDAGRQKLLVAEAGINALGVIDTKLNQPIGHIPVGWFPTAVAVREGSVLVTNAQGRGTGPSSVFMLPDEFEFAGTFHRGSVSRFRWPDDEQLKKATQLVFAANGFAPLRELPRPAVPIKYVVLIVKEDRGFDDVFGDLKIPGAQVAGLPRLARFGEAGYASGGKGFFSLQSINVTPNQHSLARQYSVSDNFYADSESSTDGERWLSGLYPEGWDPGTKRRREDARSLWAQLAEHHIALRNFGGPGPRDGAADYPASGTEIPDQIRAARFIRNIDESFVKPGVELPRFLYVSLPNDRTANPRRSDGFPYSASYVTDNDVALGTVVDYLSHSPWWREMAIFVTESSAQDGRDHIDAHRTILLGIGPYFKKHYASHTNASFPSLLKTMEEMLGLPPLNLFDASASTLDDMLTAEPDFSPYTAVPCDSRIFEPDAAKAARK